MLQKNVITEETYIILKSLMKDKNFNDFNLVGGTSLALRLGHRQSHDLDLFTRKDFDAEKLKKYLIDNYDFKVSFQEKNTLKGFINNILIDCIKYDYDNLYEIDVIDDIRMLSIEDVIAMKLVAIYQDGTRIKDFIDIAYLSNIYTLNEMIEFCNNKTNCDNSLSIMKGLIYFDNIDFDEKINIFDKEYSFDKIKKHLIKMSDNPDKLVKYNDLDVSFIKKDLNKDNDTKNNDIKKVKTNDDGGIVY